MAVYNCDMKRILIVGTADRLAPCKSRNWQGAQVVTRELEFIDEIDVWVDDVQGADIIILLNADDAPEILYSIPDSFTGIVMACAVKSALFEMLADISHSSGATWVGINGLPYFIGLPRLEISVYRPEQAKTVVSALAAVGQESLLVDDRVGMVAARVVCMIINEAYFVFQEGTAAPADVDLAMQLGTNYPQGPFSWARMIGIENVFDVLNALQETTGEEKYKIAHALRKAALQNRPL